MTYPMRRRSRMASHSVVFVPSTKTSPDVGSRRRLISLSVVVLPEPLRPRRTMVSPATIFNERFSTRARPLIAYAALRNSTTLIMAGVYQTFISYNRLMLSWIEIDATRLRANIGALRSVTNPGTAVMVVVKANAYGHGLEFVAPVVAELADWLGVN